MINQKPISFKIYLDSLGWIDNYVRDCSYYTTRNKELNRAVAMYIDMKKAVASFNYEGDPTKIKTFIEKYLSRNPGRLFE